MPLALSLTLTKGRLWLLRYRIADNLWWYIADKDSLDSDDGDMYRIRCVESGDEGLPPTRAVSIPPMPTPRRTARRTARPTPRTTPTRTPPTS